MPDAQVGDRCPMDHDGKAPELVVYALVAPGIAAGIHAAGVQEGRAAMLREVVEWQARPMCWVGQEDTEGCGVAVLAMLTGQTYAAVKADLDADPWVCEGGERDWAAQGLTSHVLDRYLVSRGFYLRRVYGVWRIVAPWPPEPFAPVHFARVTQPSGRGHFVAMDAAGCVFDPLREGAFTLADWSEVQNVVGLWRPIEARFPSEGTTDV